MYINKSKKIVLKIGSSNLVDNKGKLKEKWLKSLAQDIENLRKTNKEFVIVSSGAIALGCENLGIKKRVLKVDKSQAVASVGQIELMEFYKKIFDSQTARQTDTLSIEATAEGVA